MSDDIKYLYKTWILGKAKFVKRNFSAENTADFRNFTFIWLFERYLWVATK
mgnify:CR=1 FL=1